jgi:hypothetical protein
VTDELLSLFDKSPKMLPMDRSKLSEGRAGARKTIETSKKWIFDIMLLRPLKSRSLKLAKLLTVFELVRY